MWIFGFSLGVCSMEPCSLVPSLEYLVSNGRQVLLGGISLAGSTTEGRGTSGSGGGARARDAKGESRGCGCIFVEAGGDGNSNGSRLMLHEVIQVIK